ncbi:MAG: cytochrome c biogenesis CcdA family protein [bacterium]
MQKDTACAETRYALLVLVVALVGLGGYGGYLLYPRFNLPAVDATGLAVLSLTAGIAAFFSPCSFPLLVTLLIRETVGGPDESASRQDSWKRALSYATALSLGTITFLALTGSVIAVGGQALVEQVTFTSLAGRIIRTLVGFVLVIFGLVQLEVIRIPFGRVARLAYSLLQSQARTRRRAPILGFAMFGFAYLVAGFG